LKSAIRVILDSQNQWDIGMNWEIQSVPSTLFTLFTQSPITRVVLCWSKIPRNMDNIQFIYKVKQLWWFSGHFYLIFQVWNTWL